MTIDVEKMLRETVPGGSVCDPQKIADSIRVWFAANGGTQIPAASTQLGPVDADAYFGKTLSVYGRGVAASAQKIESGAKHAGYIDLEGLAEKLLAPREIARDGDGYLVHPCLPVADEDTRYDLLLSAFGLETACVDMESDCEDQAVLDRYFEDGDSDCSGWTPTPPAGDGWVLIEIYQTEDGPYALFTRRKPKEPRMSRRERQAASAAARDADRFRELMDMLVAVMNEQTLTPAQQAIHGSLDGLEAGTITVDHLRDAIDRAAMGAQRNGAA